MAGDPKGGTTDKTDADQMITRNVLLQTIGSLGGPVSKTIMWQMSNKGVFSESTRIDINAFYQNLKELVGPGADMIMQVTWQKLQSEYKGRNEVPEPAASVGMIMKGIKSQGGSR